MSFLESMPFEDESVSAIMGRYMDQTQAMFDMTQIIMRTGECAFDSGERELIAAFTSGLNKCSYCYGTHKSTAEAFGVDVVLIEALVDDVETADISSNFKPIFHYVQKLTLTPTRLTQVDVDKIFEAGWSENDFHFIVMICAWFNFFNRLIEGYGTENSADYQFARGKALAETGYQLSKKP